MNHPITGIIVSLFTFFVLFHCNIKNGYLERKGIYSNYSDNQSINIATKGIVKLGYQFGLGTRWRMYSPSPKKSQWMDWYAVSPDGVETKLSVPNLSPEYRKNRSFLNLLILDFKLALLNLTMSTEPDNWYRKRYATMLCKKLVENKVSILELKVQLVTISTPPITQRPEGWSLETAVPDSVENIAFYSCKSTHVS